jgi:hypothetical protein
VTSMGLEMSQLTTPEAAPGSLLTGAVSFGATR